MALAGEELEELGPDAIDAAELAAEDAGGRDRGLRLGRGEARAHVWFSDLRTSTCGSTRSTRREQPTTDGRRRRVETLLEALPYIREFHGRTVVIKYGGAAMRDEELREAFATDVVLLKYVGLNPVIVHGGGPEITRYMERLGIEVRFHEGLRVSDAETVEVAKMVLLGKLNSDIVQRLNRHGQPAVGLSGEDGALFEVAPAAQRRAGRLRRLDRAGRRRRPQPHRRRLHPGDRLLGPDRDGQLLQRQRRRGGRQGRRRARRPQGDLPHRRRGLARRPRRRGLADLARDGRPRSRRRSPSVGGGMRPKLQACVDAIRGGAQSAHIIDGRKPHSLLLELFTDAGIGTMVTP